MGRTWIRLYTGTRHHRKIEILKKACPGYWRAFYDLLEMAGECDDRGQVYVAPGRGYKTGEMAAELGISGKNLENLLKNLEDFGIISRDGEGIIILKSYEERQFLTDESKERTQKYRERLKKEKTGDGSVTSRGRHGDVTVTPRDGEVVTAPEQSVCVTVLQPSHTTETECVDKGLTLTQNFKNFKIEAGQWGLLRMARKDLSRERLGEELCKADEHLTAHPQRHPRGEGGLLQEPMRFLREWLRRVEGQGIAAARPQAPMVKEEKPNGDCKICGGTGITVGKFRGKEVQARCECFGAGGAEES